MKALLSRGTLSTSRVLLALLLSCCLSHIALADTHTWNGPADGLASVASNWLPTDVPAVGDDVVLDGTSVNDLSWDLDVVLNSWMQTSAYTGTVTLQTTYSGAFQALQVSSDMQVNGGVIQHLANDDAELYRLRVSVGGDFTLGASASMVVDTQGYTEREGPGNCGHWAGGVHGGLVDGNCASVYGSLFAPVNLGSGGYTCSGGGAIYITVLGQSTVDGLLSANGGTHEDSAPGGSVFLTTGSIVGNGTLQANGGNHSSWSRHGSGGRVAVVLTAPGSDFASWSGQVTAYGGTGNSSHAYGSAGTVYLETAAQSGGAGTLIIDNNNNAPFGVVKTPIDSSIDLYAFSEVIVRNKGDLEILDGATLDFGDLSHFTFDADGPDESFITVSDSTNVVFPDPFTISGYTLNLDGVSSVTGDWTVASDGVLAHTSNWTDSIDKLQLTVNGNLRVQAGGRVGRVGLGYRGREGIGACGFAGQWNGASHGGRGGNPRPDVAPVYGDLFAPVDPGSGGCGGKITGGGVLRLTVTGVTQLDGTIAADGTGYAGGAAGGSVYLTTASLQGSGKISANGGSAIEEGWSQGGGGGRVAVYLSTPGAVFSSFSGTISAYGGPSPNSDVSGAAGTVYLETADQSAGTGVLILDNNGRMPRSIAKTPIDSSVDLSAFSQVIIRNQADLELIDGAALDFGSLGNFVFDPDGADESFITITDPTSVTIPTNFTIDGYTLRLDGITSVTGNWTIGANGGLSHTANGGNSAYSFDLTVDGSFSVEAGGVVGGTGCGYRFNQGPSPGDGWQGASYGGRGGSTVATAANTYGSVLAPIDLGSGGAYTPGYGGGALKLTVTGATQLDGLVNVDAVDDDSGGAGGSVYLTTSSLAGTGEISADGGTATWGRGGGGGRIAVYLTQAGAQFSSFSGSIHAFGGDANDAGRDAAAGTIYLETADDGSGLGELIVHNPATRSVRQNVFTALNDASAVFVSVGKLTIVGAGRFEIGADDQLSLHGTGNTLAVLAGTEVINSGVFGLGGTSSTLSGTVTINSGSTWRYLGQSDDAPVSVLGTAQGFSYEKLDIDNAGTVFTLASDIVVNDDLMITNGTLSLAGHGVNASAANTTFSNNGVLALNGNEALSNLAPDVNSGAVQYMGTSDVTLPAVFTEYYDLVIDESGTSDPVFSLPAVDVTVHGSVRVVDGVLRYSASNNLRINDEGNSLTALSIGAAGALINQGTGNLTLGASVENDGVLTLQSSDQAGDGIAIESTDTVRRNWQGSGTFTFADVTVSYQEVSGSSPVSLTTSSSANGGNNLNWLFPGTAPGLTNVAVVPQSLVASANTQATISFTLTNALPSDGRVGVTFPAGFNVSGVNSASSVADINGNLAVSVSGQTVTITRSTGTNVAAGAIVNDLVVGPISLPTTYGETGSFTVTTQDSSAIVLDTGTAPGVNIVQYFAVSGTIAHQGSGLGGVLINGGALGSTMTASDGSYSFANVVNGTNYALVPTLAHYSFTPVQAVGTVGGDVVDDFSAILETHTISGVIRSEGGPVPGVAVDAGAYGVHLTNAAGQYAFSNIPYGSSYLITPQHSDWNFSPASYSGTLAGDLTVDFAAGESRAETTTLRGVITRDGNQPIPDAIVSLQAGMSTQSVLSTSSQSSYQTISDAQGAYEFVDVLVGDYSMLVEKQGMIISTSSVRLDDQTEELSLATAEVSMMSSQVFALWNSHLGMISILELQNKAEEELVLQLKLYNVLDSTGSYLPYSVKVPAQGKVDLPISAISGWTQDAYGMVELVASHNQFDGGVSVYRPASDAPDSFSFSFYVPLTSAVSGKSYVTYNTFYPAEAEALTHNWLSLANPEQAARKFAVRYYSDAGDLSSEVSVVVPALGRIDIEGGHISLGARKAGMIEIEPEQPSARYYAILSRYGYNLALNDYQFAIAAHARRLNGATQFIPITHLAKRETFLEATNALASPIELVLTWLDSSGKVVQRASQRVASKSTVHVSLLSMLPEGDMGMLKIEASEGEGFLVQSYTYQYGADGTEVLEATLSEPFENFATAQSGSYNTFLGMYNWLRIFNLSDETTAVLLDFGDAGGEILLNLKPFSRKDIALHEFELGADNYGAFTLQAGRPGALAAQAVRVIQTDNEIRLHNALPVR